MSRGARLGGVAGVVALIVLGVLWFDPVSAIRHGRVDPPAVPAGLEGALTRRLEEATEAVRRDPYTGVTWGRLAGVYDVHDLTAEAVTCYERAQTLDPEEFLWPYFLGRATLISDREQSLAHYRRAVELRGGYGPVHVHIAQALMLRGAIDDAETHLARAAAVDPTLIRPHVGLAQVALARSDAVMALEHLTEAQRLGAESREVSLLLADVAERQGDTLAAAAYARVAESAETDREPLPDRVRNELVAREGVTTAFRLARSEQLLRAGRLDVALTEWETAIRDDPGSAEAHAEYGRLLALAQRPSDAISQLQHALSIDPTLHRARNNLGTILLRAGRTEEGVTVLRAAAVAMPDNEDVHFNLAMALRGLDRLAEAATELEEVLRIKPDNARAQFELGLLLAATDRLDEAPAAFRAVIAAEPGRQSAYVNLTLAFDRLGRHEDAIETLREGLARFPDDVQLANGLAWRLATSPLDTVRDGAAAKAVIEPFCETTQYGDPRLLDTLAAALAETGDFDGAVQRIQQAIDLTRTAPAQGQPEARTRAIGVLERRLTLYSERRPYRQGS